MRPTQSDLHVNQPLTNISIAYMQSEAGFIADRVFPVIGVSKQTDLYWKYDRDSWNRTEVRLRAPSTETPGVRYMVRTDSYYCPVFGLHHDIDDQVRANADSVFSLDETGTNLLSQQHLQHRERMFFSTYLTSGVWSMTKTGVAATPNASQFLQWNDANSTPIENMRAWKLEFQLASGGFRPNVFVMPRSVFDTLLDHPDVIDRIKYGQTPGSAAMANVQTLAKLLELEEIHISDAIQNTADESAPGETRVETLSFIAAKNCLLAYKPSRPGLMMPSAAYNFAWTGYLGATGLGTRVARFRADLIKSDRIEMESAFSMKVIGADLGMYIPTAIA